MQYYFWIEDDQSLQYGQLLLHLIGIIVLKLFTHKQQLNLRILDNISNLHRRRGSIHGHHHRLVGIGGKIGNQIFFHILSINAYVVIWLQAYLCHCLGNLHYLIGKTLPCKIEPISACRLVFQRRLVFQYLCLFVNKFTQMIVIHKIPVIYSNVHFLPEIFSKIYFFLYF